MTTSADAEAAADAEVVGSGSVTVAVGGGWVGGACVAVGTTTAGATTVGGTETGDVDAEAMHPVSNVTRSTVVNTRCRKLDLFIGPTALGYEWS
jgi:hypothetical protein